MPPTIRENVQRVQEQIANARQKSAHAAAEITLIAVSKTQPADAIREAYEAGLRHFGENRVQEWEGEASSFGRPASYLAPDRALAKQQSGACR